MPRYLHYLVCWYIESIQLLNKMFAGTVICEFFVRIEPSTLNHSLHHGTELVHTNWVPFKPYFLRRRMVDSCGCYIEWIIWLRETGRSYFRIFFVNFDRASIGLFMFAQSLGFTVLISLGFSPVRVLVCLSVNSRYSRPPSSRFNVTSPQHISLCSWHPRRPKCMVV